MTIPSDSAVRLAVPSGVTKATRTSSVPAEASRSVLLCFAVRARGAAGDPPSERRVVVIARSVLVGPGLGLPGP